MPQKGSNPNHPKKGSSTKVYPIRSKEAVTAIKKRLSDNLRDLCLFTLGINTAYRANELLSLTVGQVMHLKVGDILDIKQSKNSRYRATVINNMAYDAIQKWLDVHPQRHVSGAPLFMSNHFRHQAITVSRVNQLVKGWCVDIGLNENYGSHTLRKTWGYHQRVFNNVSVAILMKAYGHKKEVVTLEYLCILADEIYRLYLDMEI